MGEYILQIVTEEQLPSVTTQWEFWAAVIVQIIALVGIIWKSSLLIGNKLTEFTNKMEATDKDIKCLKDEQNQMEKRIDNIEERFNHRFTEYKDFVRDLMDSKMNAILDKLENQLTGTNKKLSSIEKTLAYLKGKSKIGEMEEDT